MKEKIKRHCDAYHQADARRSQWATWPVSLLVVRDDVFGRHNKRCDDIRRWIEEASTVKGLFKVCAFSELEQVVLA